MEQKYIYVFSDTELEEALFKGYCKQWTPIFHIKKNYCLIIDATSIYHGNAVYDEMLILVYTCNTFLYQCIADTE